VSGRRIVVLETVDSTLKEARRRADAGEQGPLWIIARVQTGGYGRRGRSWVSPPGNLHVTGLYRAALEPASAALLSFAAALSVAALVDTVVDPGDVALKWPNDVLVRGRKCAGILLESWPDRTGGLFVSVGIGVNLVAAPDDVERPAIALADVARTPAPAPEAAAAILASAFEGWLGSLVDGGFAPIRRAWLERAVGLGRPVTVRLANETFDGVFEDLDDAGALRVRTTDGALRSVTAADIHFPQTERV
jgi:BirA family transcriptional regulator, biotin operon repressor / biotin---[acetyl-CoA-carboxylase] ligase